MNDLSGTPADRLLEARRQALDLDWLKLPPAEGFAALASLPAAAKQRLFAWCVASCLKPQLAIEDRADAVVESAVGRLAIPFADFWRPTAANYWGRVKKAHGLAIAKAILGPRWARDHTDAKKPILAAALEKAFDPAADTAPIGLDRAARDGAGRLAAARHGLCRRPRRWRGPTARRRLRCRRPRGGSRRERPDGRRTARLPHRGRRGRRRAQRRASAP